MSKATNRSTIEPRLLSMPEAEKYVGLGHDRAREFVEKAGAVRKLGGRILIDKKVLDRFLDQMGEQSGEK